jgi:uncharacterized membrane protein (UPF0127 family)
MRSHDFRSIAFVSAILSFTLLALWSPVGLAVDYNMPQRLATSRLVIETASGSHEFEVEVATSREERRIGLMFRGRMDDDHGMLFDYGQPREIAMWMKNTFISLDMIFIREDGTVANIAASNRPRSLRSVPSDGPVLASLELLAGTSERLGLKAGDVVRHALFGNLEATP